MKYEILRGADKIGANLIEITHEDTKILVEFGIDLDNEEGKLTEQEREIIAKNYDAALISHYHGDHAGNIGELNCPVWMGEGCQKIMQTLADYTGGAMGAMPQVVNNFRHGVSFDIGSIKVTPYQCDHSAFDSYMLLFEGGDKKILYTGDFRSGGRKDFETLLSELPTNIDVLIHEGTNMKREPRVKTEAQLQAEAEEIMIGDNPVFILQSSTNFDSLVSFHNAAKSTGRNFYVDDFQAQILLAAGYSLKDVFVYTSRLIRMSVMKSSLS